MHAKTSFECRALSRFAAGRSWDVCGGRDFARLAEDGLLVFLPFGHEVSPSGDVGMSARGGMITPSGRGAFSFICPSGMRFRRLAKLGRLRGGERPCLIPARNYFVVFIALRAWCFAVRRSWDACAARGKVGPVMGLRPLRGPPCIPPRSTPQRGFSATHGLRGHAAQAAGASLPRCARSGDLPPRRVNARFRIRLE